jgi:hypothetical protein
MRPSRHSLSESLSLKEHTHSLLHVSAAAVKFRRMIYALMGSSPSQSRGPSYGLKDCKQQLRHIVAIASRLDKVLGDRYRRICYSIRLSTWTVPAKYAIDNKSKRCTQGLSKPDTAFIVVDQFMWTDAVREEERGRRAVWWSITLNSAGRQREV